MHDIKQISNNFTYLVYLSYFEPFEDSLGMRQYYDMFIIIASGTEEL